MWVMIAAHAIVFTALCYLRYRSLFACEWQDVAAANQIAYQTAHGHPFYQSLTEQYFLAHFQPIYFLIAIPYRVWPHISTLHGLLSLSFALGALPLFKIVRERTVAKGAGALCAWIYLAYAPLNYLNLSDFRGVLLAPPIMVFGLYFIERNRFKPFLVACFLAMCCKENVALSVILLGLYGSFRHRKIHWALATVAAGSLWLIVSIKYMVPWCLRDVRYPQEIGTYWHQWTGDMTLPEFVKSTLKNPLPLLSLVFSYHRLHLLFRLLWPLCFLSLLSPQIVVIGLPGLLQLLLSQHVYLSVKRIHWVSNGVFFLCVAAIYSFVWISNCCAKLGLSTSSRRFVEYGVLLAMGLGSTLSNFVDNKLGTIDYLSNLHNEQFIHVTNMYDRRFYALDAERRKAWDVISKIPKSASVAATGHLLPALSHRRRIVEFGRPLRYQSGSERDYTDVDYIVVHARYLHHGGGHYWWPGRRVLMQMIGKVLREGRWEAERIEGLFVVLRRRPGSASASVDASKALERIKHEWSHADGVAAGDLLDHAEQLFQKGEYAAAEPLLRRLILLKPSGSLAYQRLAIIMTRSHRFSEAVQIFRDAIDRSPTSSDLRLDLATAYVALGDLTSAEQELRQAIWLCPGQSRYHLALGRVLLMQDRPRKAIRPLKRAARAKSHAAMATLGLARGYRALDEIVSAIEAYRQVVELDPQGVHGQAAAAELRELAQRVDTGA